MAENSIPKSSGIYRITCTANGKIYVGSTINLRKRWNEHQSGLRSGTHRNPHLQNAWNKYGESAFEFEVIELVMPWARIDREDYWIKRLNPADPKIGFNVELVAGGGMTGKHHSPESRTKISVALKGKPKTPEAIAKTRAANIGRKVSAETRSRIGAAGKGRKHSAALIEKRVAPLRKEYRFVDPEGNEVRIKGLYKFCRENGLCGQHMASVANGKRKHHKGWKAGR